jgi:hypothetical protein
LFDFGVVAIMEFDGDYFYLICIAGQQRPMQGRREVVEEEEHAALTETRRDVSTGIH